jgi:hypothetical protein
MIAAIDDATACDVGLRRSPEALPRIDAISNDPFLAGAITGLLLEPPRRGARPWALNLQ